MLIEILVFLIFALIAHFVFIYKQYTGKWEKHDVRYLPGYPLFGNLLKSSFLKTHLVDDMIEVYKAFPNERYVGYLEAALPVILIRDPELIKKILVKDFDHFVDHKQFFPETIEPLHGSSVFMMKGKKWRDMRNTLSPAFTGSKLRKVMPYMTEISHKIIEYLKETLNKDEEVDVNDLIQRYTNDVIALASFGLEVDSLKDRENDFYKLGEQMFNFDVRQKTALFVVGMYPNLSAVLKIKVFPQKVTRYFRDIIADVLTRRAQNKVERPDMVQQLIESNKDWTENEMVAQALFFYAASFESSSATVVMCIHELAVNSEVQKKLYQEILKFKEKEGNLSYDNINDLKYLDCVINETMRKWAAAIIMDRVCTKPYVLPPAHEGGKPYYLKPGDLVYSGVNTIHMDPKYFPDPEKFEPERFSDENKHNIKPFTFMPFGIGPRNCVGSRFALMQFKVIIYNILINFKIVKGKKTTDPILLDPVEINIRAKGGTFVKFEARN